MLNRIEGVSERDAILKQGGEIKKKTGELLVKLSKNRNRILRIGRIMKFLDLKE